MSRQSKNHTLKGGISPYSLCMGVLLPWGKVQDIFCTVYTIFIDLKFQLLLLKVFFSNNWFLRVF